MQKLTGARRKIYEYCSEKEKFPPEAYEFVTACVVNQAQKLEHPRHLSALEVLQGMQKEFKREFGPMAALVLEEWNIRSASDIGEIVFDLIGLKILSASEEDRRSDFDIEFCFFPPQKARLKSSSMEIPKID